MQKGDPSIAHQDSEVVLKILLPRNALLACLTAVALVMVVTGTLGMLGVDNPLYGVIALPREPLLDTNLRFYSGLWLVLGSAVLVTFRTFEQHMTLYRIIWAMIFMGGVGRFLSLLTLGAPPLPIVGLMGLELFGAPALAYWQQSTVSSPPS